MAERKHKETFKKNKAKKKVLENMSEKLRRYRIDPVVPNLLVEDLERKKLKNKWRK